MLLTVVKPFLKIYWVKNAMSYQIFRSLASQDFEKEVKFSKNSDKGFDFTELLWLKPLICAAH